MLLSDERRSEILLMIQTKYVETHHFRKISYLEKKGLWKTYVGSPRKELTRKTRDALIAALYDYYKSNETDTKSITLQEVFEQCEDYRLKVQNRSKQTILRDRQVFYRFFDKTFYLTKIQAISTEYIGEYFNRRTKELSLTERALRDTKQLLGKIINFALFKQYIEKCPILPNLDDLYQNTTANIRIAEEQIFLPSEIELIRTECRRLLKNTYDAKCLAILFASLTGVRAGEIPTLRWTDITEFGIHIHSQQRITRTPEKIRILEELPFTKDERRHPRGGRYFPITREIQRLLDEIKQKQADLGIVSEFIFCENSGEWLNKESYEQKLRRMCERLGLSITRNHGFRKSLNSNVLIPANIAVTERAYILGHSVEVNERNYSFCRKEQLSAIRDALDKKEAKSAEIHSHSLNNVIAFRQRKIS